MLPIDRAPYSDQLRQPRVVRKVFGSNSALPINAEWLECNDPCHRTKIQVFHISSNFLTVFCDMYSNEGPARVHKTGFASLWAKARWIREGRRAARWLPQQQFGGFEGSRGGLLGESSRELCNAPLQRGLSQDTYHIQRHCGKTASRDRGPSRSVVAAGHNPFGPLTAPI
jgi:hypothetical protein